MYSQSTQLRVYMRSAVTIVQFFMLFVKWLSGRTLYIMLYIQRVVVVVFGTESPYLLFSLPIG